MVTSLKSLCRFPGVVGRLRLVDTPRTVSLFSQNKHGISQPCCGHNLVKWHQPDDHCSHVTDDARKSSPNVEAPQGQGVLPVVH